MLIGQALITLSPGGGGQDQIHQPEIHELALEGGDDCLRKNGPCYQKNNAEHTRTEALSLHVSLTNECLCRLEI